MVMGAFFLISYLLLKKKRVEAEAKVEKN